MRLIHIGIFSYTQKDIQKSIYYHLELCNDIEKLFSNDYDVVIFDSTVSKSQMDDILHQLYDIYKCYHIQTFYEKDCDCFQKYPIICIKDLCKKENFTYYMSLAVTESIRIEIFTYISMYLLKKGYSMHLTGFKYLQYAGYQMYLQMGRLKMKDIYRKCAGYYQSSETGVEKAIRDSVTYAMRNKKDEKLKNSQIVKELKDMLDKEKIGRKEKLW